MKQGTVLLLEEEFRQFPILRAEAVPEEEIVKAEETLGVKFVADYREFISRYGGAIVGPYPVLGLRRAEPMDEFLDTVVSATQHFRVDGWPYVGSWYVVSVDHAGNPVGIAPEGGVWTYDHDFRQLLKLEDDFEGFLLSRCLKIKQGKGRRAKPK